MEEVIINKTNTKILPAKAFSLPVRTMAATVGSVSNFWVASTSSSPSFWQRALRAVNDNAWLST